MQYDVKLASGDEGKALKRFQNFAMTCLPISDEVRDVLDANDFSTSYIWKTRDFDTLPTFIKRMDR
jgi:hypothetical protein